MKKERYQAYVDSNKFNEKQLAVINEAINGILTDEQINFFAKP